MARMKQGLRALALLLVLSSAAAQLGPISLDGIGDVQEYSPGPPGDSSAYTEYSEPSYYTVPADYPPWQESPPSEATIVQSGAPSELSAESTVGDIQEYSPSSADASYEYPVPEDYPPWQEGSGEPAVIVQTTAPPGEDDPGAPADSTGGALPTGWGIGDAQEYSPRSSANTDASSYYDNSYYAYPSGSPPGQDGSDAPVVQSNTPAAPPIVDKHPEPNPASPEQCNMSPDQTQCSPMAKPCQHPSPCGQPVYSPPPPVCEKEDMSASPYHHKLSEDVSAAAAAPVPAPRFGSEGVPVVRAPPGGCLSVYDLLMNTPQLSVTAIAMTAAGLRPLLSNPQLSITVLAPTNEAWGGRPQWWWADPKIMRSTMSYHLLLGDGKTTSQLLTPANQRFATYAESRFGSITFAVILVREKNGSSRFVTRAQGIANHALVTRPNVVACGKSYVHVIDTAIQQASLVAFFDSPTAKLTVIAPSNQAFAGSPLWWQVNPAYVSQVVLYHTISGGRNSNQLINPPGQSFPTLSGRGSLTAGPLFNPPGIFMMGATNAVAVPAWTDDIMACGSSYVHISQQVLLPFTYPGP